jgi:uncharacterized protein (TIGR02147 family)
MKSIYQYPSFRAYLKASFENSKRGNPALSMEKYANHLGISCSSFKMIMSGKRNATTHLALKTARVLKLSPDEISYLEGLVLKDSAKGDWERTYYVRLLAQRKKAVKVQTINSSQKSFLGDVLVLPLLVYLMELRSHVSSFDKIDLISIAEKFGMTLGRIQELIELFKKEQILNVNEDGNFHVVFDRLSFRMAQKEYLKKLLNESVARIEKDYDTPTSFFVGYTFTVSDEGLMALQLDIKAMMEKYMAMPLSQEKIKIAQACFQVFPIVEIPSSKLSSISKE